MSPSGWMVLEAPVLTLQRTVDLIAKAGDSLVIVAGEEVTVEHDVAGVTVRDQLDLQRS